MAEILDKTYWIQNENALPVLNTAAGARLSTITDAINADLNIPLRIAAAATPDSKLYITKQNTTMGDGAAKSLSPSNALVPSFLDSTIDFQTGATTGSPITITFPASTVGYYRRCVFSIDGAGNFTASFTGEAATLVALDNPGPYFISGALPIGWIDLECTNAVGQFKTAGSATNVIENSVGGTARIFRVFGGGGSSDTGSGLGDDLNSLGYKVSFTDRFTDKEAVNTTAGYTDSTLWSAANGYWRLAYDATKTVTGAGTAMTMSGAPSFTVKVGDVLRVGTEARRITVVTTQTSYTVESAFTTNPSTSACCVSQAVYSVDLNAYVNSGLSANSQIASSLNSILMFYRETVAASDIIYDYGAAQIAFTASADGSNYTAVTTRPTNLTDTTYSTDFSVTGTNLYVRFFSNASSGSGFINLLDYKVFFHEETVYIQGDSLDTAICRSDGSGTEINCSVTTVGGKTRVITTWSFPVGVNSGEPSGAIEVFVDGKYFPRYIDATITASGYYKEISSTTIELDTDYTSVGVEIVVRRPVSVIDNTNVNSTNITHLQEAMQVGFQGFVDESSLTATTSTSPSSSQFYSTVIGRSSIPNLTANLKARMGNDRIMTQQIYELQNEFGPNGERVFGVVNDEKNQIRFVGNWVNLTNTYGSRPQSATNTTDYVEITFYGTGLNIFLLTGGAAKNIVYYVDGSGPTSVISGTFSDILGGRNYATNNVVSVVSGLTQGLHTVRIVNNTASASIDCYGFEVRNSTSTIDVRPGTSYVNGKKLVANSSASLAYNSGFETITKDGASALSLGSRGGRVLVYQKSDGTVASAATAVNSAAAYLTSADHTYEEVVRTYHPREFGAGRSDDFSGNFAGANIAFTLDDGTTTLTGVNPNFTTYSAASSREGLRVGSGTSNFITLTFVGTGLDVLFIDDGNTRSYTVTVDGASAGTLTGLATAGVVTKKVCSGLPYGTHIVKFANASGAISSGIIANFTVFQPKKPSLPSGAIEISEYNVNADFTANTTADINYVSSGVLRKACTREFLYSGTWAIATIDPTLYSSAFSINSGTSTSYVEYTFFGTGFDYRFRIPNTSAQNWTISVDGSSNLSSYITASTFAPTGLTFTASTGTVTGTPSAAGSGNSIRVSGLSLGKHTIRITQNTTAAIYVDTIDIITPIHSYKQNLYADVQNTLAVGSQGISDSRVTTPIKNALPATKAWAQAIGIAAAPTTSSTAYIPCPDMSVTVKTNGGPLEISYSVSFQMAVVYDARFQVYVDGTPQGQVKLCTPPAATWFGLADSIIVPVSAGVHKVDLYWSVSGSTMTLTGRDIKAKEL